MARSSEKRHWDAFWEQSRERGDVYSTDFRVVRNLERYADLRGARVLEVGAGTGKDSARIADEGGAVCALDYSEEALKLMERTAGSGVALICGDARALPFPDETFDIVFHQGLLEHFRDPAALLREHVRVLKRGGVLLVDVPQRYHYYTVLKHIMMALGIWFAGWETEFSAGELRRAVEGAGMNVADIYGENLSPPIWYRGMRKILLRFKIRIPMHPRQGKGARAFREGVRRACP
ncbi:MAG: class I SAM-dependent methyltransferase, partial [Chitinivibrionia bacterium]|nr:class I SAM-dependent methyltransferase [Chitinivibrionia bacterium]